MSIPSFEREIAAGRLPTGVMFGGRTHWHRDAIDKALANIAGEVSSDAETRFWERIRNEKAA